MNDVAILAGVSQMTVSLALRNHPRISEATRHKVKQAAENAGYRPDPRVSELMTYLRDRKQKKGGDTIAFLNNFPERQFLYRIEGFNRFFQGVKKRAAEQGMGVEELWMREPRMTGKRMSDILSNRGIEGIVLSPRAPNQRHVFLEWPKFVAVALGNTHYYPNIHRVVSNQFQMMQLLLRKLVKSGFRHAAFYIEDQTDLVADHYIAGLLAFQRRHKKELKIDLKVHAAANKKTYLEWIKKIKPEVVVTIVEEGYFWLLEAGYSIPEDISYADLSVVSSIPGCSGIDQPYENLGATAVDLLSQRLMVHERGIPEISQCVQLEGTWVRGSTLQ